MSCRSSISLVFDIRGPKLKTVLALTPGDGDTLTKLKPVLVLIPGGALLKAGAEFELSKKRDLGGPGPKLKLAVLVLNPTNLLEAAAELVFAEGVQFIFPVANGD